MEVARLHRDTRVSACARFLEPRAYPRERIHGSIECGRRFRETAAIVRDARGNPLAEADRVPVTRLRRHFQPALDEGRGNVKPEIETIGFRRERRRPSLPLRKAERFEFRDEGL